MISSRCSTILSPIVNLLLITTAIAALFPSMNEMSWTYELKSIESHSSNEALLHYSWHIDRVARGVYSMSGNYLMNVDVVEGDDNQIEILSYRSSSGSSDYKILPFACPRQHIFDFFNTFYKEMAMNTLKECSDMPIFEGKFQPPFEKKNYTFNKCQFTQENYPQHLQDGFYKIIVFGYGTVEWSLSIVVEVQQKH